MNFPEPAQAFPDQNQNDVAITGYGVRLPQASGVDAFWQVLIDQKCVITEIGDDRFSKDMFFHPDPAAKGKTYSVAAGQLDNIWGFDAEYFGISAREAEQMDPQQRLLLEVTSEALAEAGLTDDNWDKARTGVYVGASSSDYSTGFAGDPDAVDAQFMVGNTLSVISNRLAYVFDITGPSYTVDTACSSSFYALDQAVAALKAGKIDTAIVGAVNLLISPIPFVGFSRAKMLSPDGLCKAFDADANGYVRSEGAVVFVLRRMDVARKNSDCLRGVIHAAAINSDGRTVGLSMPSPLRQQDLLEDIRRDNPFDLNDLAFVEAHGTGTAVGDPVEASAIGNAFAKHRGSVLPIGSAKSNFGHLEPASGLVGLLKAVLALEKGVYPASLHIAKPNPNIEFDALNIVLATAPIDLPERNRPWLAGINSFGFGGANAHVILRQLWGHEKTVLPDIGPSIRNLVLSAGSETALQTLAKNSFADNKTAVETAFRMNNANFRRGLQDYNLVATGPTDGIAAALQAFAADGSHRDVVTGKRVASNGKVGFVFSGNGAQWPGMGRFLYSNNADFRAAFDKVAVLYQCHGNDDLSALLFDEGFEAELGSSPLVQPLAFAIQMALCDCLKNAGLIPAATMGHSAGEVPAAYAAGILTVKQAVHLVYSRSTALAVLRDKGGMAAVLAGAGPLAKALEDFGCVDIVMSAENSSRSTSISGPVAALKDFAAFARKRRLAVKILDIAYPFHSPMVEQIRPQLLADLKDLRPASGCCSYYSSTLGRHVDGLELSAEYWWQNTRNPVLFRPAMAAMVADGCDIIVEISPKSILQNYVTDSVEQGKNIGFVAGPGPAGNAETSIETIVARALVLGAKIDKTRFHGPEAAYFAGLPSIPWQHQNYRSIASENALDFYGRGEGHALLGHRVRADHPVWQSRLDPRKIGWLADHVVDGSVVFPATAFIEMAMAAGRLIFAKPTIEIVDMEILRPVVFGDAGSIDFRTTYEPSARKLNIETRQAHSGDAWELACFGTLRVNPVEKVSPVAALNGQVIKDIYPDIARHYLSYGPEFTLADIVQISGEKGSVKLKSPVTDGDFILDPRIADASIHGLFAMIAQKTALPEGVLMVPASFATVKVFDNTTKITQAFLTLNNLTENGLLADISLCDAAGVVRAQMLRLRLRAIVIGKNRREITTWKQENTALTPVEMPFDLDDAIRGAGLVSGKAEPSDAAVLLDTTARAIAFRVMSELGIDGVVDTTRFTSDGGAVATCCLELLAEDGLAEQREDYIWEIAGESGFPPVDVLLKAIINRAPTHVAELQELLGLNQNLEAYIQNGLPDTPEAVSVDSRYVTRWGWAAEAKIFGKYLCNWPSEKRLQILILGRVEQGFLQFILNLKALDGVVISDHLDQNIQLEKLRHPRHPKAQFLTMDAVADVGKFDVILTMDGLSSADNSALRSVAKYLASAGKLLVLLPESSGLTKLAEAQYRMNWDEKSLHSGLALPRRVAGKTLATRLLQSGFDEVQQAGIACPDADFSVLVARGGQPSVKQAEQQNWIIARESAPQTVCPLLFDREAESNIPEIAGQSVIFALNAEDGIDYALAPLQRIAAAKPARLMIIVAGRSVERGAITGFARVMVNEIPEVNVQVLEVETLSDAEAALASVSDKASEIHMVWQDGNIFAPRIMPAEPVGRLSDNGDAKVLEISQQGQFQSLAWLGKRRIAPAENQIEIQVAATALNFRDVMWAQGLLPAEALENGFVGATLGMECAGTVLRAGCNSGFSIGEKVICFAPSAFSTHVTIDAAVAGRMPDGMAFETAAALPVAFLTALYGLDEQARLRKGETVLIHGGAGGVGLAALQLARNFGAEVIATAGTPEKRQLLRDLGAKWVLDSRSLTFADQIADLTGGVDVVLNSLAGEAMERSIECLKPFGRFVELGKRDFFANSRIGLRPFRKNLTYFGVDADQLLAARPDMVARLFAQLQKGFADGSLTPPPCQVFEAGEVADAFRLMQKSGHIGKIIVRTPEVAAVAQPAEFVARDAWLVVGGTGGVGLATARWLVRRGVKKLWLVSRSGKADVTGITAEVEVVACDAADPAQMQDLFAQIAQDDVPLRGVIHGAMVLDDALFVDQTPERMAPVLRAKIAVADLLDKHTKGVQLDHFIAFSSISTFFGNPGQAAYVAGNTHVEGMIAARRERGEKGTCVAFGPIADQGYLADKPDQRVLMEKQMGGAMLNMAQALQALETVIRRDQPGVVAVGQMGWGNMVDDLKLLRSPYFERTDLSATKASSGGAIDLMALVAGLKPADAVARVVDLLRDEAAEVLRQPAGDIDPNKPLTDMGFDSLMAMSLRMQAEENLGICLPLMALVDGLTLTQLAHKVLDGSGEVENAENQLISQHVTDAEVNPEIVEKVVNAAQDVAGLTQKVAG